ncbi:MAG: nicotinate-nucleotide--dimethylbenzimidazole phosphoribosyltransferase [Candidatus Methanolliviera sp. GoM_asphalt]|nr:MAG: nicotinate-nucleotide--dimethylbenzimidazole phosphoribosyltransferase [Candidatus Methanolliviera sp. GoM_asphalt]
MTKGRFEETIKRIGSLDEDAMERARRRQSELTKPVGSLGRLEEISIKLAGITGDPMPKIKEKLIITMAGDHGVVKEGVSAYPSDVTGQMIDNFLTGGAAVNVLARHIEARIVVVDMGVFADINEPGLIVKKIGYGTRNMVKGAAMSREDAIKAIEAGITVFEEEYEKGIDIVGTGDMGIGNTTPSSAIIAAVVGCDPKLVTGRGTGIDDISLGKKINAIKKAIEINGPFEDAIDLLSKLGGFEIAGITGVILSAASHRVPVVIDGFISGASAIVAGEIEPRSKNFIFASHKSVEIGHKVILDHLGLSPILDLNMRLGEGTGAALAMSIIEASSKILNEMKTFEEAGISEKI